MPDTQHTTPSIAETARPVHTLENVTLEQFRDDILPHARPVLMKGFVRHWPAVQAGRDAPADTIAYLKRFDAGRPVETIYSAPHTTGKFFYNQGLSGLNFERHPAQISAALDLYPVRSVSAKPAGLCRREHARRSAAGDRTARWVRIRRKCGVS